MLKEKKLSMCLISKSKCSIFFGVLLAIFLPIAMITTPVKGAADNTCSITIGRDGKSETYWLNVNSNSISPNMLSVSNVKLTSDFIRKTTGPCVFTVYNSANFQGRFVTLGTDLSKTIRAGIDGVENRSSGGGDTWAIRSLKIEAVAQPICALRIGGNGVRMTYYGGVSFNNQGKLVTAMKLNKVPAMNRISSLEDLRNSNNVVCKAEIWNSMDYGGRVKTVNEFSGHTYDPGFRARSLELYSLEFSNSTQHNYGSNIISMRSQKCLDVHLNDIGRNGAKVQQWDCKGASQTNQIWTLRPTGQYYQIVSVRSGKCLDVHLGDIGRNGAKVQQWDCYGMNQTNQLWILRPIGQYYQIVSVQSGKCLDVHSGDIGRNGAKVQQWDCKGASQTNQLWAINNIP